MAFSGLRLEPELRAAGRSSVRARNRSRGDAARPTERPPVQPNGCGCRLRRSGGSRERVDGARDRAASCGDRQVQRLALAPIVVGAGLRRKHQLERLEDVLARLFPRVTLTEDTGHLGDRGDDPAVFARLIDDRQIEFANHGRNDSAAEGVVLGRIEPDRPAPTARRSTREGSLVRSEPRPDVRVAGLANFVGGGAPTNGGFRSRIRYRPVFGRDLIAPGEGVGATVEGLCGCGPRV